MSAIIEFDRVGKRYGEVSSLGDLSFAIGGGEVLGLLGHNGAGKTTSMKLILGLIEPSEGRLRVFGEDPAGPQANAVRQRLGYLPENVRFYEQLTGREVLDYFARLKRAPRAQIKTLLERVGLAHAADRRVKTYSKGMRQRLGLAQALLGEPELLLLDEPTTGLDPAATRDFYTMVRELKSAGRTVILSSHVLPGIEPYIDRALILGGGRRLAMGSIDELRAEAGLPLRINARGDWSVPPAAWPEGVRPLTAADGRLELEVAPGAKMQALRQLAGDAAVSDLEIQPPTLEHLYTHFSSREAAA